MGVPCEDMCKQLGAYPNCQCPGFEGSPASSDDERACYVKYCQDPAHPCPTEEFVTCTKELTTVSVLQWDSVFSHVSQSMDALLHNMRLGKAATTQHSEAGRCGSNSKAVIALLQNKVEDMGVPCEDMCKQLGAYPNCQCPGFEGSPASSDDERACYVKYCQDPAHPCPTEDSVFSHVSQSMDSLLHNMRVARNATKQ